MRLERSAAGITTLTIHYLDDPDKTGPEWKAKTSQGIAPDDWAREYELDERVRSGEPVFSAYNDDLHNPEMFREQSFPVYRDSWWFGGWDAGLTLNPAFVLLQVHPTIKQIMVMGEVIGQKGDTADSFCPKVESWLSFHFPTVYFPGIVHGADPTIMTRAGTDGRNVRQVARQRGFILKPQTNVWPVRKNIVNWALTDTELNVIEGDVIHRMPRMVICGHMSPILVEGFRGSYKLRPIPETVDADSDDAVQSETPLKNHPWSDVQDALQMALLVASKSIGANTNRRRSYMED